MKITIHWTFSVLLFGFIGGFYIVSGTNAAILAFLGVIVIFFSVVFHELAHMLVSNKLGYPTREIILYPLGGMSKTPDSSTNPKHELLIALSGPISNFLIALISFGLIYVVQSIQLTFFGMSLKTGLLLFSGINGVLGAFNLFIPALPLDGGRVTRDLFAFTMPYTEATKKTVNITKITALVLAIIGFFFNLWLMIIAMFIYVAGTYELESKLTNYYLHQTNILIKDIMETNIPSIEMTKSVDDALHLMLEKGSLSILIKNQADQLIGFVSLTDLSHIHIEERKLTRVGDVMEKNLVTLPQDKEASDALQIMEDRNLGRVMVIDDSPSHNMIGVLTKNDILKYVKIADVLYSNN